jgi:hypothetical protein
LEYLLEGLNRLCQQGALSALLFIFLDIFLV